MARLLDALSAKLTLLILIARFRLRAVRWAITALPMHGADGGDGDGDGDGGGDGDADKGAGSGSDGGSDDDDDASDDDDDSDADAGGKKDPDWKRMSRKHERAAKKAQKEADALKQQLKDREDVDKSEQEKAIEQAEQKARKELQSKHDLERRQDKLELATTKLAAKGLKIGSGDDAKTVRFADPDDALLHLERDIRNGDLDPEDIFDKDGRVRADQLEEALTDLLERKPHLAADASGTKKPKGSADGGKGKAPKGDEEMTVEDHLKKIRRNPDQQRDARAHRVA